MSQELEQPEIIALAVQSARMTNDGWDDGREYAVLADEASEYEQKIGYPLMTIAQHERIVAALRDELAAANECAADAIDELRRQNNALAAQLAELKGQEPVGEIRGFKEPGIAPFADIWEWLAPGTKLYAQPVAPAQQDVPELYECIGKGGEYEKLGYAIPAGTLKALHGDSGLIVYRDAKSGDLYFRDPHDFKRRMQKITAPQPVAQEGEGDE